MMRPLGVTLCAYFQFVRAGLLALLGLGALFVGGLASRFVGLAAEGNSLERLLAGLGHFVSAVLLIYAVMTAVLGIGLLLGQNWARILTILFSALGFLMLLPRLAHHHPISTLFAILNLAVVIYLLLPQTKNYFQRKNAMEARPA